MTPTAESRPDRATLLYAQWRVLSLAESWAFPDDWEGSAAWSMARAVADHDDCGSAAAALGRHRAMRGSSLADGLKDLASLYRLAELAGVVDASEPPFSVTRAFAEAWTDATLEAVLAQPSTDALTGLGTPSYLARRLDELGQSPPEAVEPHRVLVVRPEPSRGWSAIVQRSAIARIVHDVLSAGETTATLPSGAVVGVVRADEAPEHAARVRHRLAQLADAGYVTVEVMPVPRTVEELDAREPLTPCQ